MCVCVLYIPYAHTHTITHALSLFLSLSLVLSLSLPPSLSLSLIDTHTHTTGRETGPAECIGIIQSRQCLGFARYLCPRILACARAHTHTYHLLVPISISIRLCFIQTDQACATLQDNSTTPLPTSPRRWSSTWQARARSRENPDSTSTHSGAEISGPRQITGRPVDSVKVGDYRGCHD